MKGVKEALRKTVPGLCGMDTDRLVKPLMKGDIKGINRELKRMARKVIGLMGRLGGFETLMERRLNASGEMERKVMMLGWGWKGIDEEIKHREMSDGEIKEMVERNVEIRGLRRMNDTREWIGIVVSRYPGWMYIRACRCARAGLNPAKLIYYLFFYGLCCL